MIDYIYDGTFDGLLTVIWHHYYTAPAARISTGDCYQPGFLYESREVVTDTAKADKVYQAIRNKISEYDLRSVYRAWLSCDPEKEMKILRYVVLGFREGHRTSSLHGDPVVADLHAILKKISRESERMLQFVRFSVVQMPGCEMSGGEMPDGQLPDGVLSIGQKPNSRSSQRLAADETVPALTAAAAGSPEDLVAPKATPLSTAAAAGSPEEILYARIEPDNDVIELAARHFSDRFRNERIIIHDVGRNKAVIAWHGRWIVSAFAPEDVPAATKEEREYRRLWKQYFDHIAIMERKNTRCQNNFIPDRYRKHLTEIITQEDRIAE